MNTVSGNAVEHGEGLDVLRAGSFHHLSRGHGHVRNHRLFVFTPRHRDAQHRDAVFVDGLRIDLDEVVEPRQHLAEPNQANGSQRIEHALFEGCAVAGCVHAEGGRATALKAEAPQIAFLTRTLDRVFHPNGVNAVRALRSAE